MTKAREWPVRAMYILIAAALALSLFITAVPAQKVGAADEVKAEWERVETPTTDGWVLAPESTIIDYALADGGDVAYAIVDSYYGVKGDYFLLKSEDGAATWDDITEALEDVDDANSITELVQVATDWVDPDFVAVAVWEYSELRVYFSTDGGENFIDADEVEDVVYFDEANDVSDLAVSYEAAGKRDIAIGGRDNTGVAALFRCTVTGDSPGAWEDATDYTDYGGWDDEVSGTPAFTSILVTDIIFSPNWVTDKTILVTTVVSAAPYDVYLQCGSWVTSPGWNAKSTLGIAAVPIVEDVPLAMFLTSYDARAIAGMTLPSDYNSKATDKRVLWVWVNYAFNTVNPNGPACEIFLVDNDDATPLGPLGQIENGEVWLTNISYKGTIAEGEAIAGLLGDKDGAVADCCAGVQVYRNSGIHNMFICCEPWHKACKPPTGRTAMAVSYVGEDKAYAVALYGRPVPDDGYIFEPYDESAWSVTFDDGNVWNQLSLVDTYIHYFSDVAVSPDCNKMFLVSVNDFAVRQDGQVCQCDSVWLYADDLPEEGYSEYSGKWLRTWCGSLAGGDYDFREHGILRLAPEELEGADVVTVYLADVGTGNVYSNDLETLDCWTPISTSEIDDIADVALQDADTLFALGYDGYVAMFDEGEWFEAVDSEVEYGWTIAVWGDSILVGGRNGDVSYSDDGGETFTALEDVAASGFVTVAFDTYFDTNDVIYAAIAWADDDADNGIYRWVIGESESWMDLKAEPLESQIGVDDGDDVDENVEVNFTGLVLDRPGNPFTDADNGGVIYASYKGYAYDYAANSTVYFTGAARSLERLVTVCTTCLVWDFLHVGLTVDEEGFWAYPDALKICGCLSADTNSKLFAIDWDNDYDMDEYEYGSVWTFEDCYAKKAPEPTAPADGAIIPADPCSCYSGPFTLTWDTLCDACYYELQFALDEDFTMLVGVNGLTPTELRYVITGDNPSFSVMGGPDGGLSCETTYYWRVRASEAATGQVIHSWWSEGSFTIAPSVLAAEITLVAPVPGATGVATKNVGFSWDLAAAADSFDWVIDDNSDLSSPIQTKAGLNATACTYTGTLSYGTTYYWKVTAYKEGAVISRSAVGTFTTAAQGAYCCPLDGLCFDTEQALKDHNAAAHPAQPATPFWVWVVIAIGAVLVIVVIVLIFRTRRV